MVFSWDSAANGDCLLFLAGWAEQIGFTDAGAKWRGAYASELQARATLERQGGAVWAVTEVMGPPRMGSQAQRGDIALLAHEGWHLGLICTGRMWALRAVRGIGLTRRQPEFIWPAGFV